MPVEQWKVRRLRFVIVLALVVGAGAVALLVWRTPREAQPVVINNTPAPPVPTLEPVRVAHGARLYAENCAGCHGANLEGAPNWKQWLPDGSLPPPPHDSSGHTWHHPDALLLDITRNGGDRASGSRMPAFGERLSEDETTAILDFIKSKWGERNVSSSGGSQLPATVPEPCGIPAARGKGHETQQT